MLLYLADRKNCFDRLLLSPKKKKKKGEGVGKTSSKTNEKKTNEEGVKINKGV